MRKMKIQDKITVILIGCITLPIVSLAAVYLGKFSEQMYSIQEEHQKNYLGSVTLILSNECRQVTDAVHYLNGMDAVNKFITTDFQRTGDHIINLLYSVDEAFSLVTGLNSNLIGQITFYSANSTHPEHGNLIHSLELAKRDGQLKRLLESKENSGWFFHVSEDIYTQIGKESGNCMVYAEKVKNVRGELYGLFVVRVKESRLLNGLSQKNTEPPVTLSGTPPESGAAVYNTDLSRYLCQQTNTEEIRKSVARGRFYILMLTILGLSVMVVLIRELLKLVFKNMNNMIDAMEQAAHGNFSMRIPVAEAEDIRRITVQFNRLLDELNEYIEQKVMLEEKSRKAEAAALQLQMNPHFFYNGLGILQCVMEGEERYEISNAIGWLSSILRYNMTSSALSTIAEEIRCAENYMSFVNTFRDPKIEFQIESVQELLDFSVPRFILQPLAENAVKYGDGRSILILAVQEKDAVLIKVINTGFVLDKMQVGEINESLKFSSVEENTGKIGLKNIAARLKLFYGNKVTMELRSEEVTSQPAIQKISDGSRSVRGQNTVWIRLGRE